jgi:activator of HSP90 ATPase
MPIHQEVTFPASPIQIYNLLTDSDQFSAATGRPASIEAKEGAAFSLFGGFVEGRQIELLPGHRIVQAWRGKDWIPGVFSVVRFTLTPEAGGTKLTLDHSAYPEGASPFYPSWHEHLATNWPVFYFEPFAKHLESLAA